MKLKKISHYSLVTATSLCTVLSLMLLLAPAALGGEVPGYDHESCQTGGCTASCPGEEQTSCNSGMCNICEDNQGCGVYQEEFVNGEWQGTLVGSGQKCPAIP